MCLHPHRDVSSQHDSFLSCYSLNVSPVQLLCDYAGSFAFDDMMKGSHFTEVFWFKELLLVQ